MQRGAARAVVGHVQPARLDDAAAALVQPAQRFFQALDQMVQAEPWLERDKAMIDQLKIVGIERGKPFNPDAQTQEILNRAIKEAQAWLDANYGKVPPFI